MFLVHLESLLLNHKSEFQEAELCRVTEWKHNTWPAVEPRKLERVRKVYPLSASLGNLWGEDDGKKASSSYKLKSC